MNNDTRMASPRSYRKETRKMPWYTNPATTCKVLDKIAKRYERKELHDLRFCLDNTVALILQKQENYHRGN